MDNSKTLIMGIIAILLPIFVGRFLWKKFDGFFGKNNQEYMNTLEFFLKKLGATILIAFVFLWIGLSIVFHNQSG